MDSSDDKRELRNALGCFVTGVAVVCARSGSELRGFTANSFNGVSLEPALVSVCLDESANCRDVFDGCDYFAASVLSSEQSELSHIFAYYDGDRFSRCSWFEGGSGSPIIEGASSWFECRCVDRLVLGDHIMLIGEVIDFAYSERLPLIYHRGEYKTRLA